MPARDMGLEYRVRTMMVPIAMSVIDLVLRSSTGVGPMPQTH